MTSEVGARTAPLLLDWQDRRSVVVSPENQDRFVMTAQVAAAACQEAQDTKTKQREWSEYFTNFLNAVRYWIDTSETRVRVSRVVVAPSEGCLNVALLTKSAHYLFEIEDNLTDLEMQLFSKYPRCLLRVIQIPENEEVSRDAFFSVANSIQVYGEEGSAPAPSAA